MLVRARLRGRAISRDSAQFSRHRFAAHRADDEQPPCVPPSRAETANLADDRIRLPAGTQRTSVSATQGRSSPRLRIAADFPPTRRPQAQARAARPRSLGQFGAARQDGQRNLPRGTSGQTPIDYFTPRNVLADAPSKEGNTPASEPMGASGGARVTARRGSPHGQRRGRRTALHLRWGR